MSEEDLELLITTDDEARIPWKRIPSIIQAENTGRVVSNKKATRPANRCHCR